MGERGRDWILLTQKRRREKETNEERNRHEKKSRSHAYCNGSVHSTEKNRIWWIAFRKEEFQWKCHLQHRIGTRAQSVLSMSTVVDGHCVLIRLNGNRHWSHHWSPAPTTSGQMIYGNKIPGNFYRCIQDTHHYGCMKSRNKPQKFPEQKKVPNANPAQNLKITEKFNTFFVVVVARINNVL